MHNFYEKKVQKAGYAEQILTMHNDAGKGLFLLDLDHLECYHPGMCAIYLNQTVLAKGRFYQSILYPSQSRGPIRFENSNDTFHT